jgi:hypothetical protein
MLSLNLATGARSEEIEVRDVRQSEVGLGGNCFAIV